MNSEELKGILKKDKIYVNGIEITDGESWNKVIDSLNDLQQENKHLKEKIDKAIEYIKLNIRDIDYDTEEYDYLMNILKGEENE